MRYFTYLRSVISATSTDSRNGFALVIAVHALAISTVVLSFAACLGQDVAVALACVAGPLAGLGGYAYGKAKDSNTSE